MLYAEDAGVVGEGETSMTVPSNCDECQMIFAKDVFLQAELKHIALTLGSKTAERALNERYEDLHIEHE